MEEREMKKATLITLAVVLFAWPALAGSDCTTIKDGTLYGSDGVLLETGYDMWGYNYNAHMFNGTYCDAYRDAAWCQSYRDVEMIMKWNDAWLSNVDCDGDGLLDRHFGYDSYIGSGAWETNHQSGTYPDPLRPNKTCRWTYFVKIIAVPADAICTQPDWTGGPCPAGYKWFDGSGQEIGKAIWGEFATIQQVYNDPCAGAHGIEYKAARPGFGNWDSP
jgi:hypothetical protein